MDSFVFSINATIPVFLIMIVGWLIRRSGIIDDNFTDKANDYVFKIGLPVLLFKDLSRADLGGNFSFDLLFYCMGVTTVMFVLIWIFTEIFMKNKDEIGAFVQASFRSSAAVLGMAFIDNMFSDPGMAPIMIVGVVPLFNTYSVILLTFKGKNMMSEKKSMKDTLKKAFVNVAKNPIIWGVIIGIVSSFLEIDFPKIIDKTVDGIAQTGTPFALICVGASFNGGKAIKKIKPTVVASIIKLVVLPAVFLPIAIAMGFRHQELVSILILLGSPTTVTCFIMAKSMDNDEVLTSSIIVLTTLLSSVTLTAWIFLLHYQGLI
ncbi:MAG: AEC family transporter [Bacteroidales bacterium]|nr:AEC family transporter [Bacteroidales bacterium]